MTLAESIEKLATMPDFVGGAVAAVSAHGLVFRPAPGELSIVEHVCHLRDLEREGYLVRVRRIMGEREPDLDSFDGTAAARERDYLAQDPKIAAQEFGAARRELTGFLAPLTEEDLARTATFEGRRIDLRAVVAMIVEHDREHRERIEAVLDQLED